MSVTSRLLLYIVLPALVWVFVVALYYLCKGRRTSPARASYVYSRNPVCGSDMSRIWNEVIHRQPPVRSASVDSCCEVDLARIDLPATFNAEVFCGVTRRSPSMREVWHGEGDNVFAQSRYADKSGGVHCHPVRDN